MLISLSINLRNRHRHVNGLTRTIRIVDLNNTRTLTRQAKIRLFLPLKRGSSWEIILVSNQRTSFRLLTFRSSHTILSQRVITISIRQQILLSSTNLHLHLNRISRTIRISHNHLGRLLTRGRSINRTIKLKLSTDRQLTLISDTLSRVRNTTLTNNHSLTPRLKLISLSINLRNRHRHVNRISRTIRISHNHLGTLITRGRSINRTIKLKLSTDRQLTLISDTSSSIRSLTLSNLKVLPLRIMSICISRNLSDL